MAQQKKGAKVGRNSKSGHNLRYKNERRHEKSHLRRIREHLKLPKHANDKAARAALQEYEIKLGIYKKVG